MYGLTVAICNTHLRTSKSFSQLWMQLVPHPNTAFLLRRQMWDASEGCGDTASLKGSTDWVSLPLSACPDSAQPGQTHGGLWVTAFQQGTHRAVPHSLGPAACMALCASGQLLWSSNAMAQVHFLWVPRPGEFCHVEQLCSWVWSQALALQHLQCCSLSEYEGKGCAAEVLGV